PHHPPHNPSPFRSRRRRRRAPVAWCAARSAAVDHGRAHAFGTEAEVVPPLVLEPEQRAAAHAEEDVALELERGPLPAGAERDLPIVRGEPDEDGRDPVAEWDAREVNHNRETNSEGAPGR